MRAWLLPWRVSGLLFFFAPNASNTKGKFILGLRRNKPHYVDFFFSLHIVWRRQVEAFPAARPKARGDEQLTATAAVRTRPSVFLAATSTWVGAKGEWNVTYTPSSSFIHLFFFIYLGIFGISQTGRSTVLIQILEPKMSEALLQL